MPVTDGLEPSAVNIQLDHFLRGSDGRASFVGTTVLLALIIMPTFNTPAPNHVPAQLFQRMILQIITCRWQNAHPAAQVGHPPTQTSFNKASRVQPCRADCSTVAHKNLRTSDTRLSHARRPEITCMRKYFLPATCGNRLSGHNLDLRYPPTRIYNVRSNAVKNFSGTCPYQWAIEQVFQHASKEFFQLVSCGCSPYRVG